MAVQPSLPPIAAEAAPEQVWSKDLSAGARGLSLARERGWLLAWDQSDWLYLLDHVGQAQSRRQLSGLLAGCAADDASAYAAIGKQGEIWWLAPDLMTRWEKKLPHVPLALALDPFGQYAAVSDTRSYLHIFDQTGAKVCQVKTSRPFYHLTFIPTVPLLAGSADFGLVAAFNLKGETVWRDGLVADAGAMSTDGAGQQILLACFSDGLHRYDSAGKKHEPLAVPEPCRLIAQSFDGRRLLAANLSSRLFLLQPSGPPLLVHTLDKPVVALALSALGHDIFAALEKGPVLRLALRPKKNEPALR